MGQKQVQKAPEPEPPPPPRKEPKHEGSAPPPSAAELFREAQRIEQAGKGPAIDLYLKIISAAPKSYMATTAAARLGGYYYEKREAANAIKYLKIALAGKLPDDRRLGLRQKLDELSYQRIFDPRTSSRTSYYTVRPGDNLSKIAGKNNITWRLLMKLNRMKNDRIRVDDRLKVVKGPFDAVVEKSKYKLSVYLGNKYVKSYAIGIGKEDSTPAGAFKVTSKLEKPDWFQPGKIIKYGDPDNQLGTRWIGFTKGYGIHGTWEPETIGSECSEGCIRMLNSDVEELFDLLIREKSKITVKR